MQYSCRLIQVINIQMDVPVPLPCPCTMEFHSSILSDWICRYRYYHWWILQLKLRDCVISDKVYCKVEQVRTSMGTRKIIKEGVFANFWPPPHAFKEFWEFPSRPSSRKKRKKLIWWDLEGKNHSAPKESWEITNYSRLVYNNYLFKKL